MEKAESTWTERCTAQAHIVTAPWFSLLSDENQRLVSRTCSLRSDRAGAVVGRRGTVPAHWTGVVQGLLKATSCDEDGRVSSYVLARRSQWIDSEELVQNAPRLHDVVAISDTLLIAVPAVIFQRLLTSDASFCGFVLRQTSYQYRRFRERIEGERTCSSSILVAQIVVELARELGGEGRGAVELKQEDIAEFVGLSRQTVNQVLRALSAEGLLRTRYSRVEVRDVHALQRFAAASQK